ncbi:MAG: DUF4256 domain-containing protein [Sphaerochaeta sp.]|nr:DUF4256 domain-containing protein [Sphaerochaeta sp.]MDX9915649.1 DUF4256 domain-containing protein [Sphaerochaeta sp.]
MSTTIEQRKLLEILQTRFESHPERHGDFHWPDIKSRLIQHPEKMASLALMEESGGHVDVLAHDRKSGAYIFFDCAPESPEGRRNLCYDEEARLQRKANAPPSSVEEVVKAMGVELLDEEQYRFLQSFGPFDQKSSSWIKTPSQMRGLGGALFGDWRYGRTFIYHNGAQSYYSGRGFRSLLRV